MLRIIRQDDERQILDGNTCIGYVNSDDAVFLFVRGQAVKLGYADRSSEALRMVENYQRECAPLPREAFPFNPRNVIRRPYDQRRRS